MSSESLTVDLWELDWDLLESTDGLSDDEVLDPATDFFDPAIPQDGGSN